MYVQNLMFHICLVILLLFQHELQNYIDDVSWPYDIFISELRGDDVEDGAVRRMVDIEKWGKREVGKRDGRTQTRQRIGRNIETH